MGTNHRKVYVRTGYVIEWGIQPKEVCYFGDEFTLRDSEHQPVNSDAGCVPSNLLELGQGDDHGQEVVIVDDGVVTAIESICFVSDPQQDED